MLKKTLAGGMLFLMLLTMMPVQTFAAQPQLASSAYKVGGLNPYANHGYSNTCTWYVWGRAYETLGVKLPFWSNAITWYATAAKAGYSVGSVPRAGAIAVWGGGGGYGHVAFVESVSSTHMYVTEGGWAGKNGGYAGNPTCHEEYIPLGAVRVGVDRHPNSGWNDTLIGFIYLRAADVTPPVISNVQISEVSSLGYTVSCVVTDDVTMDRVQFPTWTSYKGQDDMAANWQTNPLVSGVRAGSKYTFRVRDADHNFENGTYFTDIYAFDKAGNRASHSISQRVGNSGAALKSVMISGNTYLLFEDKLTYEKARAKAAALGGHLAVITSYAEQRAVAGLVKGQWRSAYYIGGSNLLNPNKWQWETGESMKYTYWGANQPDNPATEQALAIAQSGRWSSESVSRKDTGFIVEIEKPREGWVQQEGQWYFYKNNLLCLGWQTIEGRTFYFRPDGNPGEVGRMLRGWQKIGGRLFFFQESGAEGRRGGMSSGWQRIKGKVFYFAPSGVDGAKGALQTGWRTIGGNSFYFAPLGANGAKGVLQTGWETVDGGRYFFASSGSLGQLGAAATGWKGVGGKRYYFDETPGKGVRGRMMTGWQMVDGSAFYLRDKATGGAEGTVLAGLKTINGRTYYMKGSGGAGVYGAVQTGWKTIGGKTYYFRPFGKGGVIGAAYTGKRVIGGVAYEFGADGVLMK